MLIGLLTIAFVLLQPIQPASGQDTTLFPRLARKGQVGDLVYGTVRLDGRNLFLVAAAKGSGSGSDNANTTPLDQRIQRVENRLQQILNQRVTSHQQPGRQQIVVNQLNGLFVVQTLVEGASRPLSLVTVTSSDVEIYGLPASELSEYYADQIHQGLIRGYRERQPEYLKRQLGWILGIALTAALVTALLLFWNGHSRRRQQTLRGQLNQIEDQITNLDPQASVEDTHQREACRQEQHRLNRQLSALETQTRIRYIAIVDICLIAVSFSLRLFPQSRTLGVMLIRQPVWILLLWIGVILAFQVTHLITEHLLQLWANQPDAGVVYEQNRRQKRLPTLSKTLKVLETILWMVIGIWISFRILTYFSGIQLVAGAGLLGLAASIGFQSLIKDATRGAVVLWQDAFTVGDVVAVNEVSGYVEKMSLLTTQLRSSGGELITVSNGEITQVKNMTRDWSRIDLLVEVVYDTDTDKALLVMGKTFETMAQEAEWRDLILEAPDILAVEGLAASGATLKIRAKTAPMQQWNVSREYRRRLKQQFKQAGINLGRPQQTIAIEPGSANSPPPTSEFTNKPDPE